MVVSEKNGCNILVGLLVKHKVESVVLSPGSRNAPLIMSIARNPGLKKHLVIDERSAAFVALGIAEQTGRPVALVCTSGTALLNYAPAVAEAYYKNLPLIVVSADRPPEWIDQDDSQTIRQPGALANFVKRTYQISAECEHPTAQWWVNREINDAILMATTRRKGPVHINISIDEPLTSTKNVARLDDERCVEIIHPREDISVSEARWIAAELASPRKVMIVAGFHHPDGTLNRALAKLSTLPNVVVLAENISNLHFPSLIGNIDTTLSAVSSAEINDLKPDVVLSFGGALVSRLIKRFLRNCVGIEHWHIGINDRTIDCFKSLRKRVEVEPSVFFQQLASAMQPHKSYSVYASKWEALKKRAIESHQEYLAGIPWCDLDVFKKIYEQVPNGWNLQLSNGTPIRYSQLFTSKGFSRYDCNRGVSGIDGSTSTAVGASLCYDGITLLVTGDMSAQYDIGALSSSLLTPRLKIIVLCNGGGSIFRFIPSTASLPELNDYFACHVNLPLRNLCEGYGISYHSAVDRKSFEKEFELFAKEKTAPALLAVYTDGLLSAEILRGYFDRTKKSTLTP